MSEKQSLARQFTTKQQRLVDVFDGDIKEAAEKAKISYGYARNLMTKSDILKAIRNRQNTEIRPTTIADRQERQEWWSQVMDDDKESTQNRLRASELLGKSEGDFIEVKVDVTPQSLADIAAITQSRRRKRIESKEVMDDPMDREQTPC
jgi:phage terminase small subunit